MAPNPTRAVFAFRDFRIYQLARFLLTLGIQIQSVVVGWQIYAITSRPIDLGWVGLAHFLPMACLSLLGGQIADRYDRAKILRGTVLSIALCAALLFVSAMRGWGTLPIYAVTALFGATRAFAGPASSALMTHLIPAEHFSTAVAWNSTTWQIAMILGPAVGGALYAAFGSAGAVYALAALLDVAAFALLAMIRATATAPKTQPVSVRTLLEGIRYVRTEKILLGAITLDLFAVLLGGAVALLPIYARDILRIGPTGLGVLRSAPGVGATLTAIALAYRPIVTRTGAKLFGAVAIFGVSIIAFGLSRNFALSMAVLLVSGAADMISVVLRQTLIQLHTPSEMRGRVSAISMVFVGASNELGEFESGVTAQLFGTVPATVFGGVCTLAVVVVWSWLFPVLRRVDHIEPRRA